MEAVQDIPNPYEGRPEYSSRFSQVMAKLAIWSMVQYEALVYLDADTLVFRNPDELFGCGDFCVAFVNPTTFNSGVMVLRPDKMVGYLKRVPALKISLRRSSTTCCGR